MSENNAANVPAVVLTRDDKSARALIRHERSTSRIRYAAYIAEHGVTLETVAAHVSALATLAGEVRRWESAAERKAFATKIRNGLKYNLTPASEEEDSEEGEGEGVDRLAAILKAVDSGVKNGLDSGAILAAVTAHLSNGGE